jgi:hypothetical protein
VEDEGVAEDRGEDQSVEQNRAEEVPAEILGLVVAAG